MGHPLLMCMATLLFMSSTATGQNAPCQSLSCTQDEVCTQINGVYGCGCFGQSQRNNSEIYDAYETCSGSNGSLSLSRCQLFEAGYTADSLHLNDPNCKGQLQDGRLVFSFDSNASVCGTNLTTNSTHIIYINSVGSTDGKGVISHVGGLNVTFSCVYPLTQSISMPMAIEAFGGCPNPEDGTVEVLQNGASTSSHFSFRVFTFADLPDNHIYLHCTVHLCLIESGNCLLAYNGTFQTPFC